MKITACFAIAVVAMAATLTAPKDSSAGVYNLTVDRVVIDTGEFRKTGIGYNGASPGPVLRFKEGEEVTINVTNNLETPTSVHWHGLIVPFRMDGVPTISYDGIAPGETFVYRFPIVQSGTYWFHSHTMFQEPDGAYGAIVIEPKGREPFSYDREYVVQLTDSHPHAGARIMRNLKQMSDYYNRSQQTVGDFFRDVSEKGLAATLSDRTAWGEMRMLPTDIEDLQGVTPLINGKGPTQNWTGMFKPGERIRLRFINSSAMTYFDIRIPGLAMTVVNADGNDVRPVNVDEFRIAVAETYDVIVRPNEARAYTIFAESMGRSAYARGTLAPSPGEAAGVPALRGKPMLTMADMGMAHEGHGAMAGMNHGTAADSAPASPSEMDHSKMGHGAQVPAAQVDHSKMGHAMPAPAPEVDHSKMGHAMPPPAPEMDHAKMGHGEAATTAVADKFYASGSGLSPQAANGGKILSYADLKALKPLYKVRAPDREIEIRLTGNMERYVWSINGVKYGDADPIRLRYGERVRFKFVNETMMAHPMHLHGMWSILDTGAGKWNPIKHVVSVAPGTTVYMETEVDAPGQWAFHCHLSYHAAAGMFRKVVVEGGPQSARLTDAH